MRSKLPLKPQHYEFAFIGAGKLGSLIIAGWLKKKVITASKVTIIVKSEASAKKLRRQFPKVKVTSSESHPIFPSAKIFIIAVKPQQWTEVKTPLKLAATKDSTFISIMAGLKPSELERDLQKPVVVAMTNTAVQVCTALTTLYVGPLARNTNVNKIKKMFEVFGNVFPLPEENFYKATAFGGSHPAFVLWMINRTAELIAKEISLDKRAAMIWTRQIYSGSLGLLRNEPDAFTLLEQITTPGGCTAEGIKALEELEIANKMNEVFERCWFKAGQLGKK